MIWCIVLYYCHFKCVCMFFFVFCLMFCSCFLCVCVYVCVYVYTVDFRDFIVFLFVRDPGTLKSDIVSKEHPQLIRSDLRLSNWKFEDWNYGNRPYVYIYIYIYMCCVYFSVMFVCYVFLSCLFVLFLLCLNYMCVYIYIYTYTDICIERER